LSCLLQASPKTALGAAGEAVTKGPVLSARLAREQQHQFMSGVAHQLRRIVPFTLLRRYQRAYSSSLPHVLLLNLYAEIFCGCTVPRG
jgi:hypothetical protein